MNNTLDSIKEAILKAVKAETGSNNLVEIKFGETKETFTVVDKHLGAIKSTQLSPQFVQMVLRHIRIEFDKRTAVVTIQK